MWEMANRTKTKRNQRILELWAHGWRQKSIANMLHMTESAVSMVICRARWGAVRKATPAKAVEQGKSNPENTKGGVVFPH